MIGPSFLFPRWYSTSALPPLISIPLRCFSALHRSLLPLANLSFPPQLHKVAVGRASDLLKAHGEQLPLRALKAAGAEGNLEAVAGFSRTLTEQKEQLVEVRPGGGARSLMVMTPFRGNGNMVVVFFLSFATRNLRNANVTVITVSLQ